MWRVLLQVCSASTKSFSFLNSLHFPVLSYRNEHHQTFTVRRHALESDALESDCLFKLVKLNYGSKEFITWINKLTPTQSRIVTSECGSKSQMVYAETLVLQASATTHTTTLKHRSTIHCQTVEMAQLSSWHVSHRKLKFQGLC